MSMESPSEVLVDASGRRVQLSVRKKMLFAAVPGSPPLVSVHLSEDPNISLGVGWIKIGYTEFEVREGFEELRKFVRYVYEQHHLISPGSSATPVIDEEVLELNDSASENSLFATSDGISGGRTADTDLNLREQMLKDGWLKGQMAYVRLHEGLIQIRRISLLADVTLGPIRGDKNIPIRTVQAVQYKPATAVVSGALEFVVAGDVSNTSSDQAFNGNILKAVVGRRVARAVHENTITFGKSQEGEFREFYEKVLAAIGSWGNSSSVDSERPQGEGTSSLASELRQLGDLYSSGLLTEEEFRSAKSKLLDS